MSPTIRYDGWTPDRQRHFLEAIAEGLTVEQACRRVDLSVTSAYAFRKRASGAAFALGWRAAQLHQREVMTDRMMSRALDGYIETVTRPDGSVYARHKFDNRLAMTMLARLDRLADDNDAGGAFGRAARLAAQDFDNFLDTVGGGSVADSAAWLGCHLRDDEPAALAALSMLHAAADRLRDEAAGAREDLAEAGAPGDADAARDDDEAIAAVAGLDPAARQGWTTEEWARAEAAGLVAIVEPRDSVQRPSLPQLRDGGTATPSPRRPRRGRRAQPPEPAPPALLPESAGDYLWQIEGDPDGIWFTCLPPPAGFDGLERGRYGDERYWRACTPAEAACAGERLAAVLARVRRHQERLLHDFMDGHDEMWPLVDDDDDAWGPAGAPPLRH